jgi:Uncharacterized protein conserved in bacteria (DUF2252)
MWHQIVTRLRLTPLYLLLLSAVPALGQIRAEPDALAHASPELVVRLRADSFQYFRFINRPWIARVCEAFSKDLQSAPVVQLHGDAHVEQFAITNEAWGLDDFDDSVRGPALVDVVRFLASIDLIARQRGWTHNRRALFDRFFEGYHRGLSDPDYSPPQPDIVRRLRAEAPITRVAFLAWGEAMMEPMTDPSLKAVDSGMEVFARFVRSERPGLSPEYFRVSKAGWLHMGVGSAIDKKILIRVQGPSPDPEDDELLEVKEIRDLGGLSCLEDPSATSSPPTFRVIAGAQQLGRFQHNILAAGPELVIPELVFRGEALGNWWIRSWEPSYREVRREDLRSVKDLAAMAYDSGVQLGAGCLHEHPGPQGAALRKQALASIRRLEARIRQETTKLVDEMLLGWQELGKTARD